MLKPEPEGPIIQQLQLRIPKLQGSNCWTLGTLIEGGGGVGTHLQRYTSNVGRGIYTL